MNFNSLLPATPWYFTSICFIIAGRSNFFHLCSCSPSIIPLQPGIWAQFPIIFRYLLLSLAAIYLVNTFLHILCPALFLRFRMHWDSLPSFHYWRKSSGKSETSSEMSTIPDDDATERGVRVVDKRRRWMKGQPTCQKSSVPQKCRKAYDILNCFFALCLFTWRALYITHAQYNIKRCDI